MGLLPLVTAVIQHRLKSTSYVVADTSFLSFVRLR